MIEMERRVTESLTGAADIDVHVESLLATVRAGGIRSRRRRRAGFAGGTALVVGLVVAVLLGGLSRLPLANHNSTVEPAATATASVTGSPSATPTVAVTHSRPPFPLLAFSTPPNLPVIAGAPSVLVNPADLDQPARLHISFDKLPFPAIAVDSDHAIGWESYRISAKLLDGQQAHDVTVDLTSDPSRIDRPSGTRSSTTVAGHPATLTIGTNGGTARYTWLRWQPVPGLWAQVSGWVDTATAHAVAAAVRFDRTYRCTLQLRLTWVPPGAQLFSCATGVESGRYYGGAVTLQVGTGTVMVDTYWGSATPNTTLGGRPAMVSESSLHGNLESLIQIPLEDGEVEQLQNNGVDLALVRRLAVSFQLVPGEDPAGRPDPPLA